jgi:flagellar basal body-associated protein FliL
MAKDTKKPDGAKPEDGKAAPEAAPANKKKKLLAIGGGGLGLVAAALMAALAATPKKEEYKTFEGLFVASLSPDKVTTNLSGDAQKRFCVFRAEAYFEAYDQQYALDRVMDPVYAALMKDVVLRISVRRTAQEINSDVGNAAFREDLRLSIDPLLFPVHVGETKTPADVDEASGLKMGISGIRSNFRGSLYDGQLVVDAGDHTLRLGRGQPVKFDGTEKDLRVEDENGRYVFLDVTRMTPGFSGIVKIGVHGRIREILFTEFNIQ